MEDKIVKARETGIAICELGEQEQKVSATAIVFRIGVITGCQLPTNPVHVEMLEQELLRFINEYGYANFTTEEILTAFRMNANLEFDKKVELYGALFNIDLVGKVLTQYKSERINLDGKLANKFLIIQSDNEERERQQKLRIKIQEQFDKYLESEESELEFNDLYRQLDKDGAFKGERFYEQFFAEASKEPPPIDENNKPELHVFYVKLMLSLTAQKLATKYLFKNMKEIGQTKIYDEKFKIINPGFSLAQPEMVADDF